MKNNFVLTSILILFALSFPVFAYDPTPSVTAIPSVTVNPVNVTPGNDTPDIGCPVGYMETSRYYYPKGDLDMNFSCPSGDLRVNDRTSHSDVNYIICCTPKKPPVDNFTCAPRKFEIPQRQPIKRLSERTCSQLRGNIKYKQLPNGKSQEWCCGARKRIEETSVQNYAEKKAAPKRQCLLWDDGSTS